MPFANTMTLLGAISFVSYTPVQVHHGVASQIPSHIMLIYMTSSINLGQAALDAMPIHSIRKHLFWIF